MVGFPTKPVFHPLNFAHEIVSDFLFDYLCAYWAQQGFGLPAERIINELTFYRRLVARALGVVCSCFDAPKRIVGEGCFHTVAIDGVFEATTGIGAVLGGGAAKPSGFGGTTEGVKVYGLLVLNHCPGGYIYNQA